MGNINGEVLPLTKLGKLQYHEIFDSNTNNLEPELSYIHASWTFNKGLKESCFPDCWKVSLVVPVFENVGGRSTAKSYHPVSLLFVVSKVLEKLVNNQIVDDLQKCGFFLISSTHFFIKEQFCENKSLDFDQKKFKSKLRTKPGLLSNRT